MVALARLAAAALLGRPAAEVVEILLAPAAMAAMAVHPLPQAAAALVVRPWAAMVVLVPVANAESGIIRS